MNEYRPLVRDQYNEVFFPQWEMVKKQYESEVEKLKIPVKHRLRKEKYDAEEKKELSPVETEYQDALKQVAIEFSLLEVAYESLIKNFCLANNGVNPAELRKHRRTFGNILSDGIGNLFGASYRNKTEEKIWGGKPLRMGFFASMSTLFSRPSSKESPSVAQTIQSFLRHIEEKKRQYLPANKVSIFVKPMYGYVEHVGHAVVDQVCHPREKFDRKYFGHASLATCDEKGHIDPNTYVSLYPAEERSLWGNLVGKNKEKKDDGKCFEKEDGTSHPVSVNHHPYNSEKEGGDGMDPAITPLSHDLNRNNTHFPLMVNLFFSEYAIKILLEEIKDYKTNIPSYALFAHSKLTHGFFEIDDSSHQCASIVYFLLDRAHIYEHFHFTSDAFVKEYLEWLKIAGDAVAGDVQSLLFMTAAAGFFNATEHIPFDWIKNPIQLGALQMYATTVAARTLYEKFKHDNKLVINPFFIQRLILAAEYSQLEEFDVLAESIQNCKEIFLDPIKREYARKKSEIQYKYAKIVDDEATQKIEKDVEKLKSERNRKIKKLKSEFEEYVNTLPPELSSFFAYPYGRETREWSASNSQDSTVTSWTTFFKDTLLVGLTYARNSCASFSTRVDKLIECQEAALAANRKLREASRKGWL